MRTARSDRFQPLVTMLRPILKILNIPSTDRPPVSTCKNVTDKDALAEWIVGNYLKNSSATLAAVLERQADMRFCSLLARHFALAAFGPDGASLLPKLSEVSDALGYRLAVQPSGRLADTRSRAIVCTPVKYRGFGATLNRPDDRGHLFQINMLSFVETKPLIAINEVTNRDTTYTLKGLRETGRQGMWRIFELDPALSDDFTALLVKPDKGDVRVEFAHLESKDSHEPHLIYRINTQR